VGVAGYDLYADNVHVGSTSGTNYTFGLTCGTSYTLGVEAYDAAGNHSTRSTTTRSTAACAPAPGDTSAPIAPSGLSVTSASQTSLALSWTASTDNVGVTGYDVYSNGTKVGSTAGTSYTVTGLACGTSYTLDVEAYDAAGNHSLPTRLTAATSACPDTLAPTTPTNLTITGTTQSSISLSWGASFDNVGVVGYDVYKNGNKVASTTTTTYMVTGLSCATANAFAVAAYDAAGNHSAQAAVTGSTSGCSDLLAPSVPTGATVTGATTSSVSLSWSPASDNVGVTGYDLYINGTAVGSTASTSYTFTGLACGTSYGLAVDAYDAAGNHSPTTTTSASTSACPAPTTPQIRYRFAYSNGVDQNLMPAYGYNLIDVSTKSEADATPPGTFGQVWLYDYDNRTCTWEKDDTYVRNMVSSMADDPKVAGFYFSNEPDPFACPTAPQQHKQRNALIKSLAPNKYTLIGIDANWREHFDAYGSMWVGTADYINYNPYICYERDTSTCDFAWLDHVLQTAQSLPQPYFISLQAFREAGEWRWPTATEETQMLNQLKDPSLTGLRGYLTFSWNWQNDPLLNHPAVLQAIQDFNLGASSAPIDISAPTVPNGLTVASTTQTSLSLSWTASSDNVGVTGYDVYSNGTKVGSTAGTRFTVTGLACGTSYTLGVEAYDAAGNHSTRSTTTGSTAACAPAPGDTSKPTVPSGLTVASATQTSLSLSWSASSDNVGVAGYGAYRNGTLVASTGATSYTFSGLSCGTSYTIGVDAYDAAGNRSAQASLTAATNPCPDSVAPTTPTNLTITGASATGISLSWGASFDAGGVAGYDVFRNGTKVGTTTGTTYAIGGLTCGSSYTLGVEAFDAAGNRSTRTSVVGATTACPSPPPPSPDTQAPTAPASLSITSKTETTLSLAWTASTDNVGVTGYDVYSNGTKVASTVGTSYTVTGVSCGTSYMLGVEAYDAAGNHSTRSTTTGSTAACAPAPGDPVIAAAGDICSSPTDCAPTAALLDSLAPTRVLTLGDNAYPDGTASDYTNYYDPNWGRFKAKTSPAPGNHDYHTSGGSGYFSYFGSQAPAPYYSFDIGSWHLISLNGEIDHSAGSAQETWLKNDLAAHPVKCTLAYWHEPRFSSGAEHGNDSSFDPFWRDLYAAGAEVVLTGHDHEYERFAPQNPSGAADSNGVREFVVGTGGASHYTFAAPVANSEVRDNTSFGVLKLTLHSSSYDWQFVPVAGASFTDSGSTTCH
jgi:chitodextrinase